MRGIVMAALCALPFAVIGFVGGMVFMRANYLRILRWQKKQIARSSRSMAQTARMAADLGFRAGYGEMCQPIEKPVSGAKNGVYEGGREIA